MNPSREEHLFAAAVEKPAAERDAFLDGACFGDHALRARIDALLAAHEQPETPPATQVKPARPTIKIEFTEEPPDEAVGQTLGRYKLLEQLGEGGCGVVYVAEQIEPVRRRVALKVIKLGMDTRQVVARFEAERQALAMMDHPNIAKVLDAGTTAQGRPYFVMELVRGIKITDYCDQNQLGTTDRLDLFIRVCHAIQHAHQKGIIHRDIKPSNILVTLHDGVPVPKVIDFGIAKATEGRLTDATVYTQLHQFIGTPAYMSPEQAEMSGLDIDTRSDIYSLGVLLYELLAGSTPFDGKELMASGLDAMRRTIREKEPLRPSTRLASLKGEELSTTAKRRSAEVPKLLHQLRGDLDWIVMKCLEKDRTRRYETANAVATDIRRHLSCEPVLACPPSPLYEFKKTVRRHKFGFAAAAAVMITLTVGACLTTWQAIRAMRAGDLARQRFAESEAITRFLTGVFRSPDPARDGRTVTVAETLDAAVRNLDRDLAAHPARRAQLQLTLGSTYLALGLARQGIPLQEKALEYYRATAGPEHPDTLRAMSALARSYGQADRTPEAIELQEAVLKCYRRTPGLDHSETLSAMQSLAISYVHVGRAPEAVRLLEEGLPAVRRVSGPEHKDTILMLGNLAYAYDEVQRWAEALQLREEVLALSRKVSGPEHPDTIWAVESLAASYQEADRWTEALKLREEALASSRKVNGPDHPDTLSAMLNLGISYHQARRTEDALRVRQEMLEARRRVNGPDHIFTLRAMNSLAMSHREAGHFEEAIRLGQSGLASFRRVHGETNGYTLNAATELALSYGAAGRIPEAIALEEQTLGQKRRWLSPGHPYTVESMEHLAACYDKAGRQKEAEPLRKEVAEIQARLAEKRRLDQQTLAPATKP
jgi:eukaryotic-like serine/threonine-protein kinase